MGRLEEIERIERFLNGLKKAVQPEYLPYAKSYEIHVEYLLSEVHRLRKAIEKHKKHILEEINQQGVTYPKLHEFDLELYKALEDKA